MGSRESARSIRSSTRQEAEEEAAQGQMQRVAPTRRFELWCKIEFAVRVPLSFTNLNFNGLLAPLSADLVFLRLTVPDIPSLSAKVA
jgi:hypothetical protein